jgi:hypothetical protein
MKKSAERNPLQKEITGNLEFFEERLPELLDGHRGRYALLRHRELIGIYDTVRDAKMTGDKFFSDGIFSIQKIDDTPVNLGFYSNAVHMGSA